MNPLDHLPVGALRLRELPRLEGETPMYDLLRLFETGKSHMVLLTALPEQVGSKAAHAGRRIGEGPCTAGWVGSGVFVHASRI